MNSTDMFGHTPQPSDLRLNSETALRRIRKRFAIVSLAMVVLGLGNYLLLDFCMRYQTAGPFYTAIATASLIATLLLVRWLYVEAIRQTDSTSITRKQTIDSENNQTRFLETMTHELRTPLSSIIGSSELLNTAGTNQRDYGKYINTISNNCQHLLGLVDGLLDVTKIKSGKLEPSLSCTSIADVIDEAINISLPLANAKEIKLVTATATNADTTNWIITDPLRLRQILVNLLGNAIRHTDKGSVTVVLNEETMHAHGTISISIVDTGAGIAPDEINKIFEPHFQSGSAKKVGSAGLGLSICSELATLLGGSISATSTLGKGSAFTLRIPKHRSFVFDPSSLDQHETKATKPLAGTTIVIAEDSQDIQSLLKNILTRAGASVTAVNTGHKLVDTLISNNNSPSIALVDINLDGLDGITATHMIRDKGITTPILALTASTSSIHKSSCLAAGFDDYLTKPIEASALISACVKWAAHTQAA